MAQTTNKIHTRPHRDDAHRRKVRAVKIMLMPITLPLLLLFWALEWFHHNISNRLLLKGHDFFNWLDRL